MDLWKFGLDAGLVSILAEPWDFAHFYQIVQLNLRLLVLYLNLLFQQNVFLNQVFVLFGGGLDSETYCSAALATRKLEVCCETSNVLV